MSQINPASITNQRLDIARRFIIQSHATTSDWSDVANENAALFHLMSGFNGLLQEIAQSYRLNFVAELSGMVLEANAKSLVLPILQELEQLSSDANSWLSRLQLAYQSCLECHPKRAHNDAMNLIATGHDAGASAQYYLKALTDVVLRFREESSEY